MYKRQDEINVILIGGQSNATGQGYVNNIPPCFKTDKRIQMCIRDSHNSAEPGHKLIMDHIGVTMYMDLGRCLGEGTGAALFFPLLDAATRVLSEMKTLPELDITVPR